MELKNLDLTTADFKRQAQRPANTVQPRYRPIAYQRPAAPPPVSVQAEEGARAKALLDRAIAAKGGLEKLRSIKTITATTSTTMTRRKDAFKRTRRRTPSIRITSESRRNFRMWHQVQVFDGEHAWVRDPSGVHDVPERFTRDLQMSLKRDTITLLLAAERGAIRTRILPDVQDEAGKRYHALELSGADLEPVVLYHRSPELSGFETDVCGRRRWPTADRGNLQRLPRRRWGSGVLFCNRQTRRAANPGAPHLRRQDQLTSRSDALSTPHSLSARLMLSCGEASGDLSRARWRVSFVRSIRPSV